MQLVPLRGRGAVANPRNRFEPLAYEPDPEALVDEEGDPVLPRTRFYRDHTRNILARNDSPDVGFDVSINPYRGCEHGCIYCYARPTHEFLGFSAGLDFETKILVKENASALLRESLMSPKWRAETIAIGGVTDPYQPAERKFRVTRSVLEVLREFRNPFGVITKNHLITRDVDILSEMASLNAAGASVSITSLRPEIQRVMEPRTSVPARRLAAVETLAKAGVPVNVMVAPIVPGLTDEEVPRILQAAADAGARSAAYVMLRLPHGVKELFEQWAKQHFPDRADKILNRVRGMRGGKLYESKWGMRQRGDGVFAQQMEAVFDVTCRKLGLNAERRGLTNEHFRRPTQPGGQFELL